MNPHLHLGAFVFMDKFDGMAIVGVALVAGGGYLIYPPLALLVPGIALIIIAVLGARRASGLSDDRSTTE